MTASPRDILFEVGALLDHKDPAAFAEAVLAPPCVHHGNWFFDDEPCPAPCERTHERCCACWYAVRGDCLILEEGE